MVAQHRLLIVISSMEIGGPQKSLIGLLERLDFDLVSVDLLVLSGTPGPLSPSVPSQVRTLVTPPQLRAATLPRGQILRSVKLLALTVQVKRLPILAFRLVQGLTARSGRQRARQRVWRVVRHDLPKITGRYDAAFGILGLSTYAVVDLTSAHFKYHWIRSDTRVLRRLESIDGSYYDRLSGAVAVSHVCADVFERMYPSLTGRIVVYKNDIPKRQRISQSATLPSPAKTTLLTVARLDPLKGIDMAVEACKELVDRGHSVYWVVLGDGPERASLEALAEARGLGNVFRLVGSVIDTADWLSTATIYVHPSRTEGRSNSVEEARAAGKPIVATAYDTVAEQIQDSLTGLVSSMTSSGLAYTIERLILDPELADQLGERAKASYEGEIDDPMHLLASLARGEIPDRVADS